MDIGSIMNEQKIRRLESDVLKLKIKVRNLETIVRSMDERIQKLETSTLAMAESIQKIQYWSDLQARKKDLEQ